MTTLRQRVDKQSQRVQEAMEKFEDAKAAGHEYTAKKAKKSLRGKERYLARLVKELNWKRTCEIMDGK